MIRSAVNWPDSRFVHVACCPSSVSALAEKWHKPRRNGGNFRFACNPLGTGNETPPEQMALKAVAKRTADLKPDSVCRRGDGASRTRHSVIRRSLRAAHHILSPTTASIIGAAAPTGDSM
jgi:hypothetical protein